MSNRAMTEMERDEENKVLSAVQAAGSVLLFCHISPDGDTLGSALALKCRLERMGKAVRLMLDGEVPQKLDFLPGAGSVEKPDGRVWAADLAVAVDVSCRERLGACEPFFAAAGSTAVVDHHGTNTGFGGLNLIDGAAPATAVVMFRLFERMRLALSREEAVCLYTALATDTGNFVYDSTNAESFAIMSALMEAGLPLADYSRRLFRVKELPFVRLLGLALPSLRLTSGNRVAGLRLSRAQMKAAGATDGHTEGLVDYAIDLEGVKLAYFAREMEDGRTKMSLRSLEPYHVDGVAARFGGGGHRLASGLTVDMPLEEAARVIEEALAQVCEDAL